MKQTRLITSALLALSIAPSASFARSGESTATIQAETRTAHRPASLEFGEIGASPSGANAAAPGLRREDVQAEAVRARRNGEIPFGELDRRPRDVTPDLYGRAPESAGLTRAQVRAETEAAIRAGQIQFGEDGRTVAERGAARRSAVR